MTWEELKTQGGSSHYKTGSVEPVDLYRAKGVFKPFALCSIMKYAVRNMDKDLNPKDMEKIIHYARLLIAELESKPKPWTSDGYCHCEFSGGTGCVCSICGKGIKYE